MPVEQVRCHDMPVERSLASTWKRTQFTALVFLAGIHNLEL